MTHMTSHPGQRLFVESLWQLLCWPVVAILWLLEGCNQGQVGLDYWYTGGSGAQRSWFPFHCYTYGKLYTEFFVQKNMPSIRHESNKNIKEQKNSTCWLVLVVIVKLWFSVL